LGRLPCKSSFLFVTSEEFELFGLLFVFWEGKNSTGIFLMINYEIMEKAYIGVILKKIVFYFLWIVITRSMKHVEYGIDCKHDLILEPDAVIIT
jgi:hypothetical protein